MHLKRLNSFILIVTLSCNSYAIGDEFGKSTSPLNDQVIVSRNTLQTNYDFKSDNGTLRTRVAVLNSVSERFDIPFKYIQQIHANSPRRSRDFLKRNIDHKVNEESCQFFYLIESAVVFDGEMQLRISSSMKFRTTTGGSGFGRGGKEKWVGEGDMIMPMKEASFGLILP